jgi:hypothetical protein
MLEFASGGRGNGFEQIRNPVSEAWMATAASRQRPHRSVRNALHRSAWMNRPRRAAFRVRLPSAHSAAIRTSGAAARTSASTWLSNGTKFFWNMATRLRAVSSNSALFCHVLCG